MAFVLTANYCCRNKDVLISLIYFKSGFVNWRNSPDAKPARAESSTRGGKNKNIAAHLKCRKNLFRFINARHRSRRRPLSWLVAANHVHLYEYTEHFHRFVMFWHGLLKKKKSTTKTECLKMTRRRSRCVYFSLVSSVQSTQSQNWLTLTCQCKIKPLQTDVLFVAMNQSQLLIQTFVSKEF